MKKENNKVKKLVAAPFGIAGVSLGLGVAGKMFNSPGMSQASQSSAGYIAPAVNISMGGYLLNEVKKFGKNKK